MDINEILLMAEKKNASDVHISVGAPLTFRINGNLMYQTEEVLDEEVVTELLQALFIDSVDEYQVYKQCGEVDMSYKLGDNKYRINVYKKQGCISAAIRLIPNKIPNIIDLGLPVNVLDMLEKRKGLILVTGPTGAGKSTTLASMIDFLNNNKRMNIITLENPIEYVHKHNKSIINQREIGKDTKGFSEALRASLREDPDVIMVGEMRDVETIRIAITAAETGHLVLSTLHTMNAPQTIERIIDVFPAEQQNQVRFQLSMTLNGIVSQQLLETVDKKSRALACEVLLCNSAIANLIREGKVHQIRNIMQTRGKDGMQTLEASLKKLYENKIINEDALRLYISDIKFIEEVLK